MFDADRSMSAIGGYEGVKAKLGFSPVAVRQGVADIRNKLPIIFGAKTQVLEHELFSSTGALAGSNVQTEEIVYMVSDKTRELGLTGIAIDTFSVTADQEMFLLMQKSRTQRMDMQLYGELGEILIKFTQILLNLPVPVVVLCHEAEPKAAAAEKVVVYPAVKGATKYEMLRYFDVVAYVEAKRSKNGQFQPAWLVEPTEEKLAKNRGGILGQYVAPDLGAIIDAYVKAGTPAPKILVIGKSGTGKTTSLLTLTNYNPKE